MPLREYSCDNCDTIYEYLERMSDPPKDKCEVCGKSEGFKKIISVSSFELKGTGWYATDYGKSNVNPKSTPPPKEKPDGKSRPITK